MQESLRLYRSIGAFVRQGGMVLPDIRLMVTFLWAVVGLLRSQQIHLSQWILHRPGKQQARSKERQLVRWLQNERIEVDRVYRQLSTAALVEWQQQRVEVALDTSSLWERFVIVRLSLIYRGRALPLVWKVVERQSVSVGFGDYADLLWRAKDLFPAGCCVTLLADRGFVDVELMRLAVQLGWHFILRAKQSLLVYRAFHDSTKVGRLMPPKGHIHLFDVTQVTARRFGPVALALGHVRTAQGYQPWALITDLPPSLETFTQYGRRFDIEENFLDDKSAGFQLEASELRNAQVLERLCLILATATLYLVATGTAIQAMNLRLLVDPHWQRGLSYFQLGWRWLLFALTNQRPLLAFLWFDPEPDPEPVFASRKQGAISPFAFSAITFRD